MGCWSSTTVIFELLTRHKPPWLSSVSREQESNLSVWLPRSKQSSNGESHSNQKPISSLILQLGRKLGFPTANLACNNNDKILPKNGVYYTLTKIKEKEYVSITNIGIKPSVQKSNSISIETYIIDFNQSIYGRNITIKFIDRIRDEIKFNNISDLINQITLDVSHVIKLNSLQITT
jgi:hypothetical protein